MSDSNKHDGRFLIKSFIAGGIAGMTSKSAVAPLDRIKILLQTHNKHYKHYGVFSGLRGIIEKEKFIGLYKGNGAQMVRVFPYAAVHFLSFEIYKKALTKSFGCETSANHGLKFVSGSMAGSTAVIMTYPLDLVRARLAYHVSIPTKTINAATNETIAIKPKSLSIFGTLISVFRNEGGFIGLYKGLTPTLLGIIPYAGLSFYCFERLKHLILHNLPDICGYRKNDKIILNVPSKLLCGGFAGAIAQTFSYPLDVARRRMQLAMLSPETHKYSQNVFKTLAITYREHGIVSGLYRGMSINYLRAIPMVAVSFSTYEITKQLLGLETGIDA